MFIKKETILELEDNKLCYPYLVYTLKLSKPGLVIFAVDEIEAKRMYLNHFNILECYAFVFAAPLGVLDSYGCEILGIARLNENDKKNTYLVKN